MANLRRRETPDLMAAAAAYLASNSINHPSMTETQIADELRISQPKVSGLLKVAKQRGWFVRREEKKYDAERVGRALHQQVVARFGPDRTHQMMNALQKRYELKLVPRLHVLQQVAKRTQVDLGNAMPATTDLALEAAIVVSALLASSVRIGVCWGFHLALVIAALAHLPPARSTRRMPEVFPLAGEPFDSNLNRLSSTSLSQELFSTLTGKVPQELHSLTLVPAVRPYTLGASGVAEFDRYLALIPSFKKIFGVPGTGLPGAVGRLDALLCGISHAGFPWGMKQRQMFPNQAEFGVLKDALGDIGGVLLPRRKGNQNLLARLQERWTGLQPRHLTELAQRAASDRSVRKPGVICIAAGRKKAPCCFEALKRGYINHLVVDRELGEELKKLLANDLRFET
jgi:DNA-binding transcriptional regulator LsrR (DeoR family)